MRTAHTLTIRLLSLLWCTMLALTVHAAEQDSPTRRVETVVTSILNILSDKSVAVNDRNSRIRMAVGSLFDYRAMAQSVLSTNWRQASPEQQSEFETLFAQLLENTYIGRLEAYTDQTVDYRNEEINGTRSSVDTVIVTDNNDIPVNYKLRRRSDGWFVYDVEVENVSLVSSYRETYRSVVQRSGIDGLMIQMRERIATLNP